jgi:hypothetical protein
MEINGDNCVIDVLLMWDTERSVLEQTRGLNSDSTNIRSS